MDIVFLKELRIETVIGVYDWEREIKQTVVLDLEMSADVAKAAASDHIDDTLDYVEKMDDLFKKIKENDKEGNS